MGGSLPLTPVSSGNQVGEPAEPSASPSPRGTPPNTPDTASFRPAFLNNLSFDVYVPSLTDSLCSTVRSGSTHLGQKQKIALVYKCIAVRTCFYRKELFLREETLVTVSPCEFPLRCYSSINFLISSMIGSNFFPCGWQTSKHFIILYPSLLILNRL